MKRVPALIVSGFLGSGKTTLVRRLLETAQAEGKKVAFISNELGELGIDAALLGSGGQSFVELAGGCVCCQLDDELYETLQRLHAEVDPDEVVIETSGVALPHDVQIVLYQPPLNEWIAEEAVVVVVDAKGLEEGLEAEPTFREQVESADIVVLHKVDLVEPLHVSELVARVRSFNPDAPVVRAVHGDVDPRLLFAETSAGRTGEHEPHAHLHDAFESEVLAFDGDDSREQIELRIRATRALRAKGFVEIGGLLHVVQGVGRRLELLPWTEPVPDAVRGKVVVIRHAAAITPMG